MADEKSTIMADETDEQIADGLTGDTAGWTLDELINQMCPDGVEYIQLIKVADVLYGAPFDSALFNADGIGLPLIRIRDVVRGYSETYYSGTYDDKYLLHEGDMVLGMDGNFNLARWGTTPALLNQRCCHFKTKDEEILLNSFLFHCLKPMFKAMEENIMGSTVKHIGAKHINEMRVPVPPLDVQRRIAHILDLLSELTSELTSEREARQSQYEWYRNHLLDKDTLTGGEGGGWQSLADLIEAQCPNGVEYRPITELVRLNAHKQLGASALEALVSDDGNIPLLPSSKNYDWMTTEELAGDAICEGNVIAMGRARYANMKYCSGKFVSANNVLIESIDENVLDARFLYHFLSTHSADCYSESGTYPKFDRILFEKLLVPVPPLDVQLLIVDLLDKLDDYSVRIDGVLPREITASQQRYEWWRDRLLDFRDVRGGVSPNWIEAIRILLPVYLSTETSFPIRLGAASSPTRGNGLRKDIRVDNGDVPVVLYGELYTRYGSYITNVVSRVRQVDIGRAPQISSGSVVLPLTSTTKEAVIGKPAVVRAPFHLGGDAVALLPDSRLDSSFLMYLMSSSQFEIAKMTCVNGTTVRHLSLSKLLEIGIPIPPLSIQRIVVSTLNRLDSYVNDLSSGLPAEIEARRKQYEWWRDTLLGFKEKGVS